MVLASIIYLNNDRAIVGFIAAIWKFVSKDMYEYVLQQHVRMMVSNLPMYLHALKIHKGVIACSKYSTFS